MPITKVQTKWGPITAAALQKIKASYADASREHRETFQIDGQVMLTAFARHLIDYCEAQGLVAADEAVNANIEHGNIAKGQEIVSKFFEGITGIIAYSVDHIAIQRGDEVIAIIGSPELAEALRKGVSN